MQQYRNPYDREAAPESAAEDAEGSTYFQQADETHDMKGDRTIEIVEQGDSDPVTATDRQETETPQKAPEAAPSAPPEEPAQDTQDAQNVQNVQGAQGAQGAKAAQAAQGDEQGSEGDTDAFSGDMQFTGPIFGGGAAEEPVEEADPAAEVAKIKLEMEDLRLRQAAEMENFKKRLAREHQEQLQYAAEKVLSDLLPTLDNLEYALQYGTQNEVCKDLVQGVSMTHKLLLDAVQKHGLVPVGNVGEVFDPAIHEAVGFDQNSDQEKGTVSRVLQRGYKLGNRLLRAARVMISQPA